MANVDLNLVNVYLQPSTGGRFSYVTFATQSGIQVPAECWRFMRAYYSASTEEREAMRAHARFTEWSDLMWRVFRAAEAVVVGGQAAAHRNEDARHVHAD